MAKKLLRTRKGKDGYNYAYSVPDIIVNDDGTFLSNTIDEIQNKIPYELVPYTYIDGKTYIKINIPDLEIGKRYTFPNKINDMTIQMIEFRDTFNDGTNSLILKIDAKSLTEIICTTNNLIDNSKKHIIIFVDSIRYYSLDYDLADNTHSVTSNILSLSFLSKTNNQKYTPTDDYNPATKKYVDDVGIEVYIGSDETEANKRKLWINTSEYTETETVRDNLEALNASLNEVTGLNTDLELTGSFINTKEMNEALEAINNNLDSLNLKDEGSDQ